MTIAGGPFHLSFYPNADRILLEQVLDHFGLSSKAKIGRLSKGQRAQVSLALAIAPDPELLILDDPTLGLDTNVRRDFLESMIQIIQRRGRTILFSSHVLNDVERVADRVGVMIDGVLRADCPADHFKRAVRKVIVEFGREPPELPPLQGMLNAWRVGTRAELVFVGYGPQRVLWKHSDLRRRSAGTANRRRLHRIHAGSGGAAGAVRGITSRHRRTVQ